jgi:hypothetical protein
MGSENKKEKPTIAKEIKIALSVTVLVIGLPVAIYVGWFSLGNKYGLSSDASDWGTLGDYLNPFITMATLIWVAVAVYLQRRELKAALDSLADSAKAQRDSGRVQAISAELEALSAKLNATQSDIESIRSDLRYYGGADNTIYLMALDGYALGEGRSKVMQKLNAALMTKIKERDLIINRIDYLIGAHKNVAKHLSNRLHS